jgi:drug/metabolite transporter (DMT)-like permease
VGVCWLLRTEALRNINPTFVGISSPLSAVITGIVSLIMGLDKLTLSFAIGSVLIVLAMTLSALPEKSQSAIRDNLEK